MYFWHNGSSLWLVFPEGPLVFQAGYHPRKMTFKTHPKHVFFRDENRPLIRVFACIFLNLSVMSFPKFANLTQNTPFFPIWHVLAPLNDVREYIAWSWKITLITWFFFIRGWYPTSTSSGPGIGFYTCYTERLDSVLRKNCELCARYLKTIKIRRKKNNSSVS